MLDILRIYGSLLWRMEDVTPHIAFIGRLFGPAGMQSHPHSCSSFIFKLLILLFPFSPILSSFSLSITARLLTLSPFHFNPYSKGHSLSLFNLSTVRAELAVVYTAMSKHPSSSVAPSLRLNALTIAALIAVDRKLIDSRDFAECMPVFQALGGEVKDRIALLSATATASTAQANAATDAMPVSNAGKLKRSRIEITEPNLNKSRKTASTPFVGAGNTGETGMGEIVLDPETLTWSALLGPQGAHYLLSFVPPPIIFLYSSLTVIFPSCLFFLSYCCHSYISLLSSLLSFSFSLLSTYLVILQSLLLPCLYSLLYLIMSSL